MITANGIENASAVAGDGKPFGDKKCMHGVTLGLDCEECFEEIRACMGNWYDTAVKLGRLNSLPIGVIK